MQNYETKGEDNYHCREVKMERDALRKLARMLELKFKSGNDIAVERITVTRAEYELALKAI